MATKQKLVEIARSFSYKLNLGNYQTADFFCSAKQEVPEGESEEISNALFEFCKDEVEKSVANYKLENLPEQQEPQQENNNKETDEIPL